MAKCSVLLYFQQCLKIKLCRSPWLDSWLDFDRVKRAVVVYIARAALIRETTRCTRCHRPSLLLIKGCGLRDYSAITRLGIRRPVTGRLESTGQVYSGCRLVTDGARMII